MRHRVHGRKLGRTTAHRKAMFRNQLTALFTHERIVTTIAKAKELRPQAERMVTLARTGTLENRRRVLTMVPDKEVVRRLFDDIAPRFMDRNGGYTRILRMGRRKGDNAELAIIEFVDYRPKESGRSGDTGGKGSLMDRAKGFFGGGRKPASDDAAAEEAPLETAADAAPAEESDEKVEAKVDEPEEKAEVEATEAEAEAPAAEDEVPDAEAEPAESEEPEKKKDE